MLTHDAVREGEGEGTVEIAWGGKGRSVLCARAEERRRRTVNTEASVEIIA